MNLQVIFDATDAAGDLHKFLIHCMMREYQHYESYIYGMMTVNMIHLNVKEGRPKYLVFKNQPLDHDAKSVIIDFKIIGYNGKDLTAPYDDTLKPKPQVYTLPEPISPAYPSDWISMANIGVPLKVQYYFYSEITELSKLNFSHYIHTCD